MTLQRLPKQTIIGVAVCLGAYLLAARLWFPPALTSLQATVRLAMPPDLEHSPQGEVEPGTRLEIPRLELIGGAPTTFQPNSRLVVTAFDASCPVAQEGAQFWNRLSRALTQHGVPHLATGCGSTVAQVRQFAQEAELRMPVYYGGLCEPFLASLGMKGGIVQYVLEDNGAMVDAWVGVPIFRYKENEIIAQMLDQTETWAR